MGTNKRKNKKANILVTGGAGFIGSHLVDRLMEDGNKVVVLDNLSTGKSENISKWFGFKNFKFVKGDLLFRDDIKRSIADCQTVFHLAGNADVRIGYSDPKIHYEQNVLSTFNLLEAMREVKKCEKIVFTSTSTIYGEANIIPTPESYGPLIPISLYGSTKLACESLISGYCNTFGMTGVIIRFANVLGPRSGHGVLYDFIHKLREDKSYLEILGDGNQNKSYMYVSDCISGILRASSKARNPIQILNVGSTSQIKVKDIASVVVSEMGLKKVHLRFTGGVDGGRGWIGDVKDMLLGIEQMATLNWKPKYTSKTAVTKAVRAMLDRES